MIFIIWGKKVIILCGLIASGKTTYAMSNFRHFTDLDMIPGFSTKEMQINWTKQLLESTDVVCHITCYPTEEEVSAFEEYNDVGYLWLNTSLEQSKSNMLMRNRERDINNLNEVLDANKEYHAKYKKSQLDFRLVKY